MKFWIQVDLKNFEKAIREISKDETQSHLDEVLQIVKKNRLYRVAIWEFCHNEEFLKKVKLEFAHYLAEWKYFEEAGMMYMQALSTEKAIECLLETDNYHLLFTIVSAEKKAEIIKAYVDKLESKKLYKVIGEVYLNYSNEIDKSVDYFLKDSQYFKAIEIASKQPELLKQC